MASGFNSAEEARAAVLGRGTGRDAARFVEGAEAADAFSRAARALLRRWTALGLAVENEWGGPESESKAENLFEETLQLFEAHGTAVTHEHLSNMLAEAMADDFGVHLEDRSDEQIAHELVELHSQCVHNSITKAQQLIARDMQQGQVPPGLAQSRGEEDDAPDANDSDDDDEDASDQNGDPASQAQPAHTADARTVESREDVDMETQQRKQQAEAQPDEDGFVPVVRGRRRR